MNMKHLLLLALLTLTGASQTWADEEPGYVYMDGFTIDVGRTATADVHLKQTADHAQYLSLQFDLSLSQGLKLQENSDGTALYERGELLNENHRVSIATISEDYGYKYRVLIYATAPDAYFSTTDGGKLLTLHFATVYHPEVSVSKPASLSANVENQVVTMAPLSKEKPYTHTASITSNGVDRVLDEMSTTDPTSSDVAQSILVRRTIKAGQWSTFILPFNCSGEEFFRNLGDDVEIVVLSGATVNDDKSLQLQFSSKDGKLSCKETIKNSGYFSYDNGRMLHVFLIKTSKDISEMRFDGATMKVTARKGIRQVTSNTGNITYIMGTYSYIDNSTNKYSTDTDCPHILFLSNDQFYYSAKKVKMKGMRGYFYGKDIENAIAAEAPTSSLAHAVSFFIDGETTDIPELREMLQPAGCGIVYTLQGQLVGRNISVGQLQKGIYIINGKKTVVN